MVRKLPGLLLLAVLLLPAPVLAQLRRWLGLPDRGATPPYDVPPDAAATEQRAEQAARIWLASGTSMPAAAS